MNAVLDEKDEPRGPFDFSKYFQTAAYLNHQTTQEREIQKLVEVLKPLQPAQIRRIQSHVTHSVAVINRQLHELQTQGQEHSSRSATIAALRTKRSNLVRGAHLIWLALIRIYGLEKTDELFAIRL